MPPPLPPFQGGAAGDRLQWFVLRNGAQEGRYPTSSLQAWMASGQLQPGTPVWGEGLAGWQPLASVPELAIGLTGRPAQGVDTPLTSPHLPLMGNLICIYCLVGYPILWLLSNMVCCLTGPSYHEESNFFGMEVLVGLASAVITFAIGVVLGWGGWQLRNLAAAGRTVVLAGLWSSLASSLIFFLVQLAVFIAAATEATDPSIDNPAAPILSCFLLPISLGAFVFETVALVWLLGRKALPFQRS